MPIFVKKYLEFQNFFPLGYGLILFEQIYSKIQNLVNEAKFRLKNSYFGQKQFL